VKKPVLRKPRLPKVFESGTCENCGAWLTAEAHYCSQCGQKRIGKEDHSFIHLIRESFLDYFHLDSKLTESLYPLFVKPGFLTNEFLSGRRMKYIPPFKMFLVITVIYFLLHSVIGGMKPEEPVVKEENSGKPHFTIAGIDLSDGANDSIRKIADSVGLKAYVDQRWKDEPGWARYLMRKALKISMNTGEDIGDIMQHNASRIVFLLIPVFALLLKLIYIRRKRLYFEHLIFSLHFHSFLFLLMTLAMVVNLFYEETTLAVLLLGGIYLFLAMRRVYRQSRRKTMGKLVLLGLGYLIFALPVFFIVLAIVSLIQA